MNKIRADKARQILEKHGLDAMLFTAMSNIRYLTGFTGSDGALIMTAEEACFMSDSRYVTQAREQITCDFIEYQQKISGIVDYLNREVGSGKVGVEGDTLTVGLFRDLQARCSDKISLHPLEDSSHIRAIKDSDELAKIEKAAEISNTAFLSIIEKVQPGIKESEVALELEIACRRSGSEDKAFDFIVASGIRGALPHGVASGKIIDQGDLVTIDFGSCYQGYFSDETVNLAVGPICSEMHKIHDIVLKAHDLAIKSIKPGKKLREIDKVARDFIADKGYGGYFGHGLGHGVGLDVHEWPRVSPHSDGVAEPGMVFTVEPGIYIPGSGGARVEDIVVVTDDGCRCLTGLPKELRINS